MRARIAPFALVLFGLVLTVGFGRALLGLRGWTDAALWAYLFLTLMAIALLALATAVAIDPRPPQLRQALAGAALAWLVMVVGLSIRRPIENPIVFVLVVAAAGASIVDLASTTSGESPIDDETGPFDRFGAIVAFAMAIVGAAAAAVTVVSLAAALSRAVVEDPIEGLPWGAFALVLILPPLAFAVASFLSHQAAGRTFYEQTAANRRNSLLLLVALIGIAAATAEIIAISLTGDPIPALVAAAAAVLVGLGAIVAADRGGAKYILDSAGAVRATRGRDAELLDVVQELALAASIPVPATYVVEDGSMNAFATGRDPDHAAIAVTRGLLDGMDREQLQGVVGHELGHIRNLDIRYALYIAVFIGLIALVTDAFLQMVVEGWKRGAFVWRGRGKNAGGTLITGLLVGLFLLIVAGLLRAFAPLFAALVQAATSREREFLADATSVEFTRNARGLERALASLEPDTDILEAANRGTQHMWFRNPIKAGSDGRVGLLSTHPSLAARIDRMRTLQGLGPLDRSRGQDPTDHN